MGHLGVRTDKRVAAICVGTLHFCSVGLVFPLYPDGMQADWIVGSGLEACRKGHLGCLDGSDSMFPVPFVFGQAADVTPLNDSRDFPRQGV
jgi:hypothetical protein